MPKIYKLSDGSYLNVEDTDTEHFLSSKMGNGSKEIEVTSEGKQKGATTKSADVAPIPLQPGAVKTESTVSKSVNSSLESKNNKSGLTPEEKVANDIAMNTKKRKEKGLGTYYSPEKIALKVKLEKESRLPKAELAAITAEEDKAYKEYNNNRIITQADVDEVKINTLREKSFKTVGEKREDDSWTSVGAAFENAWEGDGDKAYIPFASEREQVLKEAKQKGEKLTETQISSLSERKYGHRQYAALANKKTEQYLKDISGSKQDLLESRSEKVIAIETPEFKKKAAINSMLNNDLTDYANKIDKIQAELKSYGENPKFETQDQVDAFNIKIKNLNDLKKFANISYAGYTSNLEAYDKSAKKLGTANEEFDLAKRHYGIGWEFTKIVPAVEGFVEGLIGVANMVTDVATWAPRKAVSMLQGEDEMDFLSDTTKAVLGFKARRDEMHENFYGRKRKVENVETFGEYAWDLIASQIPNFVLMALTGGTGNAALKAGAIAEAVALNVVKKGGAEIVKGALSNSAKWLSKFATTKAGAVIVPALKLETTAAKLIASSSAGGKYLELAGSNNRGETDYNPIQMVSASLLFGYAEGVGENVTTNMFKGAIRPLQALGKEEGKQAFMNTLKKETLASWFGGRSVDMLNENMSEQFTNLAQNSIDKFLLGKNVGLLDNVGDVLKDTTVLTALMLSAPHIAGAAIKPFMPTSEQSIIKNNGSEIARLMVKMNTPGITPAVLSAYQSKAQQLTEENSNLTNKIVNRVHGMPKSTYNDILELNKSSVDIQEKAGKILNSNATEQVKAESIDILQKEYKTKMDELSVIHGNIKMIDGISKEYSKESTGKIYNMLVEAKDIKSKLQGMNELEKEEATERLRFINEDLAIEKISLDIAKDFEKTKGAVSKLFGDDTIVKLADPDEYRTILKEDGYNSEQIKNQTSNNYGTFYKSKKTGKLTLLINSELNLDDGISTTGRHELLHRVLYTAIQNDPTIMTKVGKDLFSFLESYYGKDKIAESDFGKRVSQENANLAGKIKEIEADKKVFVDSMLKRYKVSKLTAEGLAKIDEDYNARKAKAEADSFEETLNYLSEAIASGDLVYNETLFTKLRDILRKVFQNYGLKINLTTGKDTFDFIRDYNKSFDKGEFTNALKELATKGEFKGKNNISLGDISSKSSESKSSSALKSGVDEIQSKIDKLEEQYENGQIEYDYYENQIELYKEQLKKAKLKPEANQPAKPAVSKEVAEENEIKEIIKKERGSISSDKVQQLYDKSGKEAAAEIIQLFKPITKKIVDKRRDAPGFNRELLTDEIETGVGGILDLITKYNPESGIPLAAWINKYLPVRAIATSRRLLDKQFSKDVTEEKDLMATETADQGVTVNVAEKPKYKNALESNVFEPAVVEAISSKLLSTVRLLKNRIDATVTLNRTVTPIIAEIRDDMGKQADIDVKTAMGGKKDGQLKKFLLSNKKYILENMTTTWLMGHDGKGGIPQGIQKRIDGSWVNHPDWEGKKIDRESTSTDNAGRTSGAELVRRVSNINSRISEADFLAQILGSDGNPIRGRKESLAKAIAEEISFDIIKKDLAENGVLAQALEANQNRLLASIDTDLEVEFARQSDRGNIKNSEKLIQSNKSLRNGTAVAIKNLRGTIRAANGNLELEILAIAEWLASDGRAIRTSSTKIYGEAKFMTTNNQLLTKILANVIKNSSIAIKAIDLNNNKATFTTSSVGKNKRSIYIGDNRVKLYAQISNIKKSWEGYREIVDNDAGRATARLLSTVKWAKENGITEDQFKDYILLLSKDQRSAPRKASGAGLGILKSEKPYLEHNPPRAAIRDEIVKVFAGEITPEEFKIYMASAKVNLIPKALNDILEANDKLDKNRPGGPDGLNRMHRENVMEYLKNLLNSGYEVTGLENVYGEEAIKYLLQDINLNSVSKNSAKIKAIAKKRDPMSSAMSQEFNKIIENVKGMEHYKVFSDIVAKRRGAGKKAFDFYVPPSAADFELLLYNFLGKGKEGEAHKAFFDNALLKPYINGVALMDSARQSIKNEYKKLLNAFPAISKKLESLTPDEDFTYDQAIRVAMWAEGGIEIPGLSERDTLKLVNLVNSDTDLLAFKQGLMAAGRQQVGWIDPSSHWDSDTIISDLYNITEGIGRKKFLGEFIENVENIFGTWDGGKLSGPNMNKIEAVYGTNVRSSLEDVIYRMSNGKNKSFGSDTDTSRWNTWVNGSIGTIMFLNTRSAILQLTSAVNFLNWRDNNPFAAAAAFANQKQYWSDFAHIFNSDKLKERRGGLKDDIQAAEIANAARGSKSKAKAVVSYLLKIGYGPTQIADSFAIASGGAPFYRNRINSYLKEGKTQEEAEAIAWEEFSKVADETQQSGDAKDISKQQASGAGRLILAFQNTTMQQSRSVKKAYLDLKNGRGDAKTNISKIVYYLAVQNIIFASLQSALFAVAFDDDDDEDAAAKKESKVSDTINSVADSILRGTGFGGAIVATLKNIARKYLDEKDKKFKADYAKVILEAANISPPIGSKLRKMYSGLQASKFNKDLIEERGWGVMQDGRIHLGPMYNIVGLEAEALINVPFARIINKIENISHALNSENEAWQRVMVALGWNAYSIGIEDTKGDTKIREEAKEIRKAEGLEKAKLTREATSAKEKAEYNALPQSEKDAINIKKYNERKAKAAKKFREEAIAESNMTADELAIKKFNDKIKRKQASERAKNTRLMNQKIKDSIAIEKWEKSRK
jgi:hypothetical protein